MEDDRIWVIATKFETIETFVTYLTERIQYDDLSGGRIIKADDFLVMTGERVSFRLFGFPINLTGNVLNLRVTDADSNKPLGFIYLHNTCEESQNQLQTNLKTLDDELTRQNLGNYKTKYFLIFHIPKQTINIDERSCSQILRTHGFQNFSQQRLPLEYPSNKGTTNNVATLSDIHRGISTILDSSLVEYSSLATSSFIKESKCGCCSS